MYPSAGVKGPYTLTAVPVGGGTPVAVTCASPACTLRGLSPGMAYTVSATGTDAASGKPTPPSPAGSVVTPSANAPAIAVTVLGPSLSVDISPTSSGVTGPYTLTAAPIGVGKPITVTAMAGALALGVTTVPAGEGGVGLPVEASVPVAETA